MNRFLKTNVRRLLNLAFGSPSPKGPIRNWYQYYFDRYKKLRRTKRPWHPSGFYPPFKKGMVSIVLPVYNGEKHVSEAIESILGQSYKDFELIIVNDGSTDSSPEIIDIYSQKDKRIKVIHQENMKLPMSLSRGFRKASGEFLTWTSDDNRLKPNCLERLVDCLNRHPEWDMVYANMDIIGEDGAPLKNSSWYSNYQVPPGSEHIHLPEDTAELNVWPNQYIGAAFLYRAKVASLLRDYSRFRFTIEDYDYFMLINEFFTIGHADFKEPIYEYRFHDSSLTSKEKQLQILEQREYLMVFDDFRRDFNLTPLCWIIEDENESHRFLQPKITKELEESGDIVSSLNRWSVNQLPSLWFSSCFLKTISRLAEISEPPVKQLPANCTTILIYTGQERLPKSVSASWDLCVTMHKLGSVGTEAPYQGWHYCENVFDVLSASEILCRRKQFEALEKEIFEPSAPLYKYSIVICTYKRTHILERAITAAFEQNFPKDEYEIIIVNNDLEMDLDPLMEKFRKRYSSGPAIDLVLCPIKGLSFARNAGISRAKGEVVCFLDDDAIADSNWLLEIDRAYEIEPAAGLVGGVIKVQLPQNHPKWLESKALPYWSHFDPAFDDITWTEKWWEFPWGANWTAKKKALLEIGGFRCRYGRKGNDFGGGEELLAGCLIQRLGYKVGINPKAKVDHVIETSRFTKEHVKNTIKSALLVNYRLQTDLYIPRWMNGSEVAKKTGSWTKGLIRYFNMTPFERLEIKSNISAHMALLKLLMQDYKNRIQKPEQ